MNQERRKQIQEIIDVLKGQEGPLENILEKECYDYENLPPELEDTEESRLLSDSSDDLDEAYYFLKQATKCLISSINQGENS